MSIFRRKSLDQLLEERGDEAHGLKKTLTAVDLMALGIGGIIGAGIFAVLGSATSGGSGVPPAGPGVTVSILLTAIACGFCALCYAEFASLVPIAGSAYTYSYATLGELVAWIIGWDLILEYAVGNIAVAISWAAYFRQLMQGLGLNIPAWMASDYRSAAMAAKAVAENGVLSLGPEASIAYQAYQSHPTLFGIPIVCNLLSVLITAFITWLLVIGIKESARFNNVIVVLKVITLLFFIGVGAVYVKPANWHPFFPGGIHGIWTGASLIFFAYIGFDAVSTAAEECKDPGRDMPRGIIGSLVICTVLYIAAAVILTGMIPFTKIAGTADPLAAALHYVHQDWAAGLLAFGAVIAMTAVLLVFQLGQPRILMSMSRDGLLGPWFQKIHPKYRTPHVTTILTGVFVAFFSAIANIDEIVQLTNIGTLFAFVLVCIGILILRRREPDRPRKFRVPFVPWVPLLGIAMCVFLMSGLPRMTWIRFVLWLAAGLAIYCLYGVRNSCLATASGYVPLKNILFSFRGRIGRGTFWACSYAMTVLFGIPSIVLLEVRFNSHHTLALAGAISSVLLFMLWIWAALSLQVKRWHDLDKSGWMALIVLIPIIGGLIATAWLGFYGGTAGPNRYGQDPLRVET